MMSPNKTKKGAVTARDSSPEAGPSCSKRARSKLSSDDDEETVPRKSSSSKYGSKFMRSPGFTAHTHSHQKPAELFRKDLISAMKLADSEPLQEGSYFLISDPWRQEWEKGVQVPVNKDEVMQADIRAFHDKSKTGDFKMPHKMLHERVDNAYKKGQHELTGMQQLSEQLVRYDLDDLDVCWLEEVNFQRRETGLIQINEWNMERMMEALETQCHEKMTSVMRTEEGMGIEYDEDIVCDVCRSPESEDTNEMVFCDGCDVCIHQACYGIQSIPEGTWLCRVCALGIKPTCILCPKMGGALKSTRSGTKWAHVSCALWIPEVSIGIPEKMEPITKISNIPPSRWALICTLCKERVGACIQCSVKTCKTAFHVTCGFRDGLEMKTILDETDEHDGVKLKAYCPKHTKKRERGHSESDSESPSKEGPPTPKKEMTQQERENLRIRKLKSMEEEFYSMVEVAEVAQSLQLEEDIVDLVFVYWKLKRKCNWEKPLLTPKTEEADILEKQQEDSLVARMKMFVHLRQDLERVRNLCYMIGKREKMKRQFFRSKEYVFTSMVKVLVDKTLSLSDSDVEEIVRSYRFESIYDDYGSSVAHLPPEASQDEDDLGVGKEVKVPAMAAEDKQPGVESTAEEEAAVEVEIEVEVKEEEEEVEEEDPSLSLPPGERYAGEFVRSGFFHRRRHKKWIKGSGGGAGGPGKAVIKKKLACPATVVPSASEASAAEASSVSATKHDKDKVGEGDDCVFFGSGEESEDDKEKCASRLKEGSGGATEGEAQLPIPKLVVKSPLSKHPHHRSHHKKRHRGRKAWHANKSHLELSSEEDEVKVVVAPATDAAKTGELSDRSLAIDVVGGDTASLVPSPSISVNDAPPKSASANKVKREDSRTSSGHTGKSKAAGKSKHVAKGEGGSGGGGAKTDASLEKSSSVRVKSESVHDMKREKDGKLESATRSSRKEGEHSSRKEGEHSSRKGGQHSLKKEGEHSLKKEGEHSLKKEGEHSSKNEGEHSSKKDGEHSPKKEGERKRKSKREHRKSGHRHTSPRPSAPKQSAEPVNKVASGPDSITAEVKETVPSSAEPDAASVPSTPKARQSNSKSRHSDSGKSKGKHRSEKTKEREARVSKDSGGSNRRHHLNSQSSRESGERSNIFESFARSSSGEGSCEPKEVKEPAKLPESPNRHLSSNWHQKLKILVADTADSSKLSSPSKSATLDHRPVVREEEPKGSDPLDLPPGRHSHSLRKSASKTEESGSRSASSGHRSGKSGLKVLETSVPKMPETESSGTKTREGSVQRTSETSVQKNSETSVQKKSETSVQKNSETNGQKILETEVQRTLESNEQKSLDTGGQKKQETSVQKVPETTVQKVQETSVEKTSETSAQRTRGASVQRTLETELRTPEAALGTSQQRPRETSETSDRAESPDRRRKSRHRSAIINEPDIVSDVCVPPSEKPAVKESRRREPLPEGPSSEARKHRRRSSHEARIKLNKVMASDPSSDDDFEPSKPVVTTFSKRQRHQRRSKKPTSKRRSKDTSESDETTENDDDDEDDRKRRASQSSHQSQRSKERLQPGDSLQKNLSKNLLGGTLRPELSRLLRPSDLIVEDALIKRVENGFLRRISRTNRRRSLVHAGGDSKQRKIDSFFGQRRVEAAAAAERDSGERSPQSKNRVLNEIPPEKSGGNFQNNLFGAHFSPRGSLSGYKIPKKNSSSASTAGSPTSPLDPTPPPLASSAGGRSFSSGGQFRSFKSEADGSPRLRRGGGGGGGGGSEASSRDEKTSPRKCTNASTGGGGSSDLDASSVVTSGGDVEQCEPNQFSMDSCRGYRSQSPSSEASTAGPALHSDSRESTPRRLTRSQVADEMVENSPSPHAVSSSGSGSRMKLREGLLKAPQFSS